MLDIKFIRENKEAVENSAKNKGYDVSIDRLIEVDDNVDSYRLKLTN